MLGDEDEELLVRLVQHGDAPAFERMLVRLYPRLRRYLNGLVGAATADDVLQETALQIFRQVRYLREPKAFRAWAYRLATRIAFIHLQRERRWREIESDPEVLAAAASRAPVEEEIDPELLESVAHISPASRAVLLLHYQQQRSIGEVAAILAIPLGTAKSRLAYGVAQLRSLMKER